MNDNQKYIEKFINDIPFDSPDNEHRDELKKQLLNSFPKHRLQSQKPTSNIRRIIMKSKITKFAAAAVLIIAIVLSLTIWDTPAYALEQTIKAYEGLRYVHIKDFREGESEPREFWVELDEKEQVKRIRVYIPAWAEREGPLVAIWSEGKLQTLRQNNNIVGTVSDETLGPEILKIINEFDPRMVVKDLYKLETEGQVQITTNEPSSKSEPIVITAEFQNNKATRQIVLFVDQSTKLVTRIILPINDTEDGYQHSLEFSDYNVALDDRVFMLEPTPEIAKSFMKDINTNLAKLDINKSTMADVIKVLGEPWAYRFRGENYFKKDNLPAAYTMSYPGGFIVNIYKNQVMQWGCQQAPGNEIPGYTLKDSIQIGTSLEDIFKKLGYPSKVVEGFGTEDNKIMYEDNTIYANMNINERKGFCFAKYDENGKEIKIYFDDNVLYKGTGNNKRISYYGTVNNNRRFRFSFLDDKVGAMYEYRTEPLKTLE
ncbi:MAG: hypothetical protein JXA96_00715 [Sedimentisphaerales bacterium]|nr:hypothetical protein [Sedimentisphaerales bacterium]